MMPGRNGHLAIVPGTIYAACAVHASWAGHQGFLPGTWIRTDIVHLGDDPLWSALPEGGPDGPDNRAINVVHAAPWRRTTALTREFGTHVTAPIDAAERACRRKRMRAAMTALPDWAAIRCGDIGVVRKGGTVHCDLDRMEAGHECR